MPTPYGYLVYQLPNMVLTVPITRIKLRDATVITEGTLERTLMDNPITIPAGRHIVNLTGEDGRLIYQSAAIFRNSVTADRDAAGNPATLTVVQPWGQTGPGALTVPEPWGVAK